jgi:hypothetical protein
MSAAPTVYIKGSRHGRWSAWPDRGEMLGFGTIVSSADITG